MGRVKPPRPHRARRPLAAALGVLLAACLAFPAGAFINRRFTPAHLVAQSGTILSATLKAGAAADGWTLDGVAALKGQNVKASCVSLAEMEKEQADELRKILSRCEGESVLVFSGASGEEQRAFLHADGLWLNLDISRPGAWRALGLNQKMSGTYAGGTDMLARMVRYLLSDPENATIPVSVGFTWAGQALAGKLDGALSGLSAVEWPGSPRTCLFAACPNGDRLFRLKEGDAGGEDLTAACRITTRSRQHAWLDLNHDGSADLVSWDGETLAARLVLPGGALGPADPAWAIRLDEPCLALAPIVAVAVGGGAPAVLASTPGLPVLLFAGEHGWRTSTLPAGGKDLAAFGAACACVVADLDNDGFPDVLQPREQGGLFWRGAAAGFDPPASSAVTSGGGTARHVVGDWDGDGWLDVFVSGEKKNELWENGQRGGFRPVLRFAGSLSYKAEGCVSGGLALDLNADGRSDLGLFYVGKEFAYHFNRGFRCLGEEGELKLPAVEDPAPGGAAAEAQGQVAGAVADFNGDGAPDLAVALANGQVLCCFTENLERPGLRIRLPRGATGPVTVSVWQGAQEPYCVAAHPVFSHAPGVYGSLREAGACTVRWRLPGKPEQARNLTVEKPIVFVIGE